MHFLDRFRKQKGSEAPAAEAAVKEGERTAADDAGRQQHAANNDRRFFYMVEDRFAMKSGTEVVVVGNVHGTICVDDAIYILQPHGVMTLSMVKGMEIPAKGVTQRVKSAADQAVSLLLEMKKEDIDQFSVITSIRPQMQVDVNQAVENPIIAGLLFEARRFGKNLQYYQWLIFSIAHGHYLAPMQLSRQPRKNGDGTATFEQDSTLGFMTIQDPADPEGYLIPVFTDWAELKKWKALPKNAEGNTDTLILRFPDAVTMAEKEKCGGIVINPFSTNQCLLDRTLIARITGMEGYKREFVEQKADTTIKEETVKQDTEVMLGVPAETGEVRMIREELCTYGRTHTDIRAVYFILQMTKDGKKTYLIYLDTDAAASRQHFQNIYTAIRGCAVQVQDIAFLVKGQAASFDQYTRENAGACVYHD